jgi:hypothetical protein
MYKVEILQQENTEPTLSLSQRAYVIAKSLRVASRWLLILVIGLLFFNIASIGSWYFTHSEITARDTYFYNATKYFLIASILISFYIVAWFFVKAPHAYKKLEEWDEDYLHNAYILIFDTTVPKGDSTGEKILNLSKLVFPELRSDLYVGALDQPTFPAFISTLVRKFSKSKATSEEPNFNYIVDGSYSVDLALNTKVGYFIVKDFKDTIVTLKDLKLFVELIQRKFKNKIFRTMCVARKYDRPFLQTDSLEHMMTKELKASFSLDLLVEEKVGYSVLWIG